MMIFIAIFPFIIKKYGEDKGVDINLKFVKFFCVGCFAFVTTLFTISLISEAYMYRKTVGAYKQGDYQIVEGYVENFDINGVSFSYSDYSVGPGYNNTKSHGGVITGDGQHLKIGYIYYDEIHGNIIVYIEELP